MISSTVEGDEYVQVTAVDTGTNEVTVSSGSDTFLGIAVIDNQDVSFLTSTMTDKSSDITWSGDPDYLESRYVRFSYRIRYDDMNIPRSLHLLKYALYLSKKVIL